MRLFLIASLCLITTIALAAGYTFSTSSSSSTQGVSISDTVTPSSADCTDEVTKWQVSTSIVANTIDGGTDGEYDLEYQITWYDRYDNVMEFDKFWVVRNQSDDALLAVTIDVLSHCDTGGWPDFDWYNDIGDGHRVEVDVYAYGEPNDGELLGGSVFATSTTTCN